MSVIEEKYSENGLLTTKNLLILISSVVLAICYDHLMIQPVVAVSYPIFVMVMLATVYGNSSALLIKKPTFGWFLIIPLISLALTRFFFGNTVLHTLNSIIIPALFVAHILLITENNRHEWFYFSFLKDIVCGLIIRPLQYVKCPILLILNAARQDSEVGSHSVIRKVFLGLFFSLPILIVAIMLLSSADQVFSFLVSTLFSSISISEVVSHSLIIVSVTVLTYSFIWSLGKHRSVHQPNCEEPKKFDVIIVISGLSAVTVVYLMFSIIQFSYLFGNISNQLPDGLTFAEYARKGFFELVVVALINICLVVGTINFTSISDVRLSKILKILNSVLILSTFVILLSAHYRMSLYEESYGYTYLRVFTHYFMAVVFTILIATLGKVWINSINLGKCYITIGIIAYLLINYINVDVIIASKNLERYYRTQMIDVDYMAGLSFDTVPYLVALLHAPDPKIEANARKHVIQKKYHIETPHSWQGYTLPEQRAKSVLREALL